MNNSSRVRISITLLWAIALGVSGFYLMKAQQNREVYDVQIDVTGAPSVLNVYYDIGDGPKMPPGINGHGLKLPWALKFSATSGQEITIHVFNMSSAVRSVVTVTMRSNKRGALPLERAFAIDGTTQWRKILP